MLDQILESVRLKLPPLAAGMREWEERAADSPPTRDFEAALRGEGLGVIAEIKRRSPSAGEIAPGLDPAGLSSAYERGGAAAISVLTEEDHFGGSLDDLTAVRTAVAVPVLRKDFILHPAQVAEARAEGADAILLIAAVLRDPELEILIADAHRLDMAALVEAHDAGEVERAVTAGARVVGINNRDLRTFEVDLRVAERLRPSIPRGVVAVAESGVNAFDDAVRMAEAGYDAVLVGQVVAASGDPEALVADFAGAAR